MLKSLSYTVVFLYLAVQYGQNLLPFGSDERVAFYFVGMSLAQVVFSFTLFSAYKNLATSFYLFLCLGTFINELYFEGALSYVDISFGCLGIVYLITENKIKKCLQV